MEILKTTVALVSLEFGKEGQARELNVEVDNMKVEFKAIGLEESR